MNNMSIAAMQWTERKPEIYVYMETHEEKKYKLTIRQTNRKTERRVNKIRAAQQSILKILK